MLGEQGNKKKLITCDFDDFLTNYKDVIFLAHIARE